jgi:hypothetical protein
MRGRRQASTERLVAAKALALHDGFGLMELALMKQISLIAQASMEIRQLAPM